MDDVDVTLHNNNRWAKKVREPNWDPANNTSGEPITFKAQKDGTPSLPSNTSQYHHDVWLWWYGIAEISRLSIQLRGVECILHHNSAVYDHLVKVSHMSPSSL
jgi:hypothetical protein